MAAKVQDHVEERTSAPNTQEQQKETTAKAPLDWKLILVLGLIMGVGWTTLFASGNTLSFLAGVVPIFVGFYVGRKVKQRTILTSAIVSLIGLLVTLSVLAITAYVFLPAETDGEPVRMAFLLNGAFGALLVFPFAIYGAFISQRSRQQREAQQDVLRQRGGRLEHPGRVRDIDDLRALTLNKFAAYVVRVFKQNGFALDDYRFDNKEKHVDIYMTHEDQRWVLRCTVEDKVKPGMVQELVQKMRGDEISKGVVLTSTEFSDGARRWAENRRDLVVVDGETLMQMAES